MLVMGPRFSHRLSLLCFLVAAVYCQVHAEQCSIQSPVCSCVTSKHTLSLKELMQSRAGEPLFVKNGQYTYFINPCDSSVIQQCAGLDQNLEACQVDDASTNVYGLGAKGHQSVTGDPELGTVTFINQYTGLDNVKRIMRLELQCGSNSDDLIFVKEDKDTGTYTFRLETSYVCLSQGSGSGGLSAGSVMVILFFVGVVIYLVGGVLFLKFVRKAEGREVIPNYEFWTDFPALVKDGVMFTCRGCKADSTYEQI